MNIEKPDWTDVTKKQGTNVDNGIVALFDVLGYTSLAENAETEYVAEVISNLLHKIPEMAKDKIVSLLKDDDFKKVMEEFLAYIQWLVYSDTIIIALGGPAQKYASLWVFYLTICAQVLAKMFENGLPLRGAISVGSFYIAEKCFAGKAVVDAYNLARATDWTGCVFHSSATNAIEALKNATQNNDPLNYRKVIFDITLQKYKVCMHGDRTERLYCVNWPKLVSGIRTLNIREMIINSFQMHKKDLSPKEYPKITNTEMFMTLCKSQMPTE